MMAPLETTKSAEDLGRELLLGPQHVNNIVPLLAKIRKCLKVCSKSYKEREDNPDIIEAMALQDEGMVAMRVLKEFFSERLTSGYSIESQSNPPQHKDKVANWIGERGQKYIQLVCKLISNPSERRTDVELHKGRDIVMCKESIDVMFTLAKSCASNPGYSYQLLQQCFSCVLAGGVPVIDITFDRESFGTTIDCVDVQCAAWTAIRKALAKHNTPSGLDADSQTGHYFTAFHMLNQLPHPPPRKVKFSKKSSSPSQNADESDQNRLWNTSFLESVHLTKSQTLVTVQRSCFSKAWMAFLQSENLPESLLKVVLPKLQDDVIPFLKNPLLLSDCLTIFVATGGNFAILALGGLFVLMTQYGLEYPDFYTKLLSLLSPTMFVARNRRSFLRLTQVFLKSPALPSSLAEKFIIKLADIALQSPPNGALISIGLIHNMLKRHPRLNTLVNAEVQHVSDEDAGTGDQEITRSESRGPSLWQVQALKQHYFPDVSQMASCLDKDFSKKEFIKDIDIEPLLANSYNLLFNEEMGRKVKAVPVAYRMNTPQSVFTEVKVADSEKDPESKAESAFPGWSLQGCV